MNKPLIFSVTLLVVAWATALSAAVIGAEVFANWNNLTPGIWLTIAYGSCLPLWGVFSGVTVSGLLLWATYRAGKPR